MIARITLKRALVALWCLAAAGCGKMAEESASNAVKDAEAVMTAAEAAVVPEPAGAATPAAVARTPEPAPPPAPQESIAGAGRDSIADLTATAKSHLPPPPAAPDVAQTPGEPAAVAAPARPALGAANRLEHEQRPDEPAAASPLAAETLDLKSLLTRLRKTKAMNLRTKLAVKKESDELLKRFRAYHAEHSTATLDDLRQSYDSLFRKLYSLLEDADPPLAHDIDRSRGAIWSILADPLQFGASAPDAGRSRPQA